MTRRYAILEDNQRELERRLEELRSRLPAAVGRRICAAFVIGSVARGEARDGSDLDLVLALREETPHRSDYTWWDKDVAPRLGLAEDRFPVRPLFIGRASLATTEPNLRAALDSAVTLFDDQP